MGLTGIDTGRLSTYSQAVATDRTLSGLRDKVELDFRTGIPNTFARIELSLTDGTRLSAEHDAGIPAIDTADQGRRLEEKFAALVEPVLGSERCLTLIAMLREFENLENLSDLMTLTGG
jgi:hypothetical protein